MGCALLAPNTPAGLGGSSRLGRGVGNEQARCAASGGGETQAPGWRQPHLVEHTGGEGHTAGLQTFLKRQQRLARARGFHHDQARGIEPEAHQTGGGRTAELSGQNFRPAPEHKWFFPAPPFQLLSLETAHTETEREAQRRHPIAGRGAGCRRYRLHLVHSVGFKPGFRQALVGHRASELPRRVVSARSLRWRQSRTMTLDLLDRLPERANEGGARGRWSRG